MNNNSHTHTKTTTTKTTTRIISPVKSSVSFGINDYPGTNNDLQGCVNDATSWKNLLETKGFNTQLFVNSMVTRDRFIQTVGNLIADAKSGYSIVVTNSGHGTSIADTSVDEQDSKDEAICLYDGILLDDEIRAIMAKISDGVNLFFVSDSCFSGTITRGFLAAINKQNSARPRYMPPPDNVDAAQLQLFSKKTRNVDAMKEVVLTGCKDNEYSYDAFIGGKYSGAMSYYAQKVIMENGLLSYNKFYEKLRVYLPNSNYAQTPLLEGTEENKNKIMFE